jgi:phosphoserine phosphatase RsbU/P
MLLIDAQLTASEVLQTFHRDEPFLFLGAAFTTTGIVTLGFCALRRRFDALLVWLGVFAFLYGQRMWLNSGLLHMTLAGSEFFARIRWAVNFVVPIPAFLFLQSAGLTPRRGKIVTTLLCFLFLGLGVATFIVGRQPLLREINDTTVVIALGWILLQTLRKGSRDRDVLVLQRGLMCFIIFALWDNTAGIYWQLRDVEPYGFGIFLASMGYVAARRMLDRDVELRDIQQELELARRIQLSILPAEFPASNQFRVAAKYVPMTSVAGDFYDFLIAGEQQLGLFIADVSGHGVPAALIASMVKMAATSQRVNADHPAKLLTEMNAALFGNTQGQYVTAAYVHLNSATREMRYAAAGHPAMLLLRDGRVTEIHENGLLLSASEQSAYSEKSLPLQPGDRLLLYTDGLIEARNAEGQMFGEESLSAAMHNAAGASVAEAADRIIASVQQWARWQDDDLTVLVCDFLAAV